MCRENTQTIHTLFLVAVGALVLTACSDSSDRLLLPTAPRFAYEELEWFDVDGLMNIAEEEEGIFGNYPEWNGEDPSLSASTEQQYTCPNVAASVMLLSSNRGTFVVAGVFSKIGSLPNRHGYPAARYEVPNTQHYNLEADYWIQGGVVDVTCRGRYFGTSRGRVWVGDLRPFAYFGSGGPSNTGSGGRRADQGWVFKNAFYQNGSTGSGDWAEVLDRYLQERLCTVAWTLFLDGNKVC